VGAPADAAGTEDAGSGWIRTTSQSPPPTTAPAGTVTTDAPSAAVRDVAVPLGTLASTKGSAAGEPRTTVKWRRNGVVLPVPSTSVPARV
jgi:hypothetical protein